MLLTHARLFTGLRVTSRFGLSRLLSSSSTTISLVCPSCSHPLRSRIPACTNCWFISRLPSSATSYDVLGLPSEPNPFRVETSLLKRRFLEAQSVCHPDTWASKGTDKKEIAQGLSSKLNEAYQGLLKPLNRAEYILSLNGRDISESDQLEDADFVTNIMEAREVIETASPNSALEVESVMDQISGTIHIRLQTRESEPQQFVEQIKQLEGEMECLIGKKDWDRTKDATVRLKYLQGVHNAGRIWKDNHS